MYNTKQITTMKKTFFYMLACILPALALTSCSSDDDDSTPQYDFGLEVTDVAPKEASVAYNYAKEEIAKFQKTYVGKKRFATDKEASAKFDEGAKNLNTLAENFALYVDTHDAGAYSFSLDCKYTVTGGSLSLNKFCNLDYRYNRAVRQEAKKKVEINLARAFESSKVAANDVIVSFEELAFGNMDKDTHCTLDMENVCVVNAETFEYNKQSPFQSLSINETTDGTHELVLSYNISKESYDTWKGDWYLLVPIMMDNTARDIKLNVTIK